MGGRQRRKLAASTTTMAALNVYRANLGLVREPRRLYPMPPRAITLDQFRILTRKRDVVLARLAAGRKNPNSSGNEEVEGEANVDGEEKEVKNAEVSETQQIAVEGEAKANEERTVDANEN